MHNSTAPAGLLENYLREQGHTKGIEAVWHGRSEFWFHSQRSKFFYLFVLLNIYLCGCSKCWLQHVGSFSCGKQDLIPWPRIESGPRVGSTESYSHWTTREVPRCPNFWHLTSWPWKHSLVITFTSRAVMRSDREVIHVRDLGQYLPGTWKCSLLSYADLAEWSGRWVFAPVILCTAWANNGWKLLSLSCKVIQCGVPPCQEQHPWWDTPGSHCGVHYGRRSIWSST